MIEKILFKFGYLKKEKAFQLMRMAAEYLSETIIEAAEKIEESLKKKRRPEHEKELQEIIKEMWESVENSLLELTETHKFKFNEKDNDDNSTKENMEHDS